MVFIQQPNRPHSYTPLHHKMVNIHIPPSFWLFSLFTTHIWISLRFMFVFHWNWSAFWIWVDWFQVGLTSIPQWLEFLLAEKFFNPCLVHESDKKNEKNTFCLDCCISLCPHCLHPHQTHRLLQVFLFFFFYKFSMVNYSIMLFNFLNFILNIRYDAMFIKTSFDWTMPRNWWIVPLFKSVQLVLNFYEIFSLYFSFNLCFKVGFFIIRRTLPTMRKWFSWIKGQWLVNSKARATLASSAIEIYSTLSFTVRFLARFASLTPITFSPNSFLFRENSTQVPRKLPWKWNQ